MTQVTGAQRKNLNRAWGEHLNRYPWDHFVTLTFRRESSPDFARRHWLRYVRRLEIEAGIPLVWFYGTEYGRLGRLHIHALTLNTGALSITCMHRKWFQLDGPRGFTKICLYDPTLGAAGYVAKYITKELAEYDISDRLPEAKAARGRQLVIPLGPGHVFDALRRNAGHKAARLSRLHRKHEDSRLPHSPQVHRVKQGFRRISTSRAGRLFS